MQAEIIGTKFVLNSVRINPVKAKHIHTWKINAVVQNFTTKTPNKAAKDIKIKMRLLFVIQGCCSLTQAPIVRAQISGKIISDSCEISATKTITNAIIIPKRYLSILILFNTSAFTLL